MLISIHTYISATVAVYTQRVSLLSSEVVPDRFPDADRGLRPLTASLLRILGGMGRGVDSPFHGKT